MKGFKKVRNRSIIFECTTQMLYQNKLFWMQRGIERGMVLHSFSTALSMHLCMFLKRKNVQLESQLDQTDYSESGVMLFNDDAQKEERIHSPLSNSNSRERMTRIIKGEEREEQEREKCIYKNQPFTLMAVSFISCISFFPIMPYHHHRRRTLSCISFNLVSLVSASLSLSLSRSCTRRYRFRY